MNQMKEIDFRIDDRANRIHRSAVVDPRATMGIGNYIGPMCVIGPGVDIGSYNRFESHVAVGLPPEVKGALDHFGIVRIGDRNTFREFVTIQSGHRRATSVANDCLMLRGSHLSHDSILQESVVVSCNVMIGGHTVIMRGANIGLSAVIHQWQVIGSWAMIGMGTVITSKINISPGGKFVGVPARPIGSNTRGLDHHGITTTDMLDKETLRWEELRAENSPDRRID
jgi:UDP-N-acetylglucosamine acyltransferase